MRHKINRRRRQKCAKSVLINRETHADGRRLFNRATRAIKGYVIPLARDKKTYVRLKANTQGL